MKLPPIYLLRHGQTVWNLEGRLQGQMDSELTDLGVAQAQKQGYILQAMVLADGARYHVSPLGRTRHTAKLALGDVPATFDARLMEIGAGDWEGRLRWEILPGSEADEKLPFDMFADAPGGEGLRGLEERIHAFLTDLDAPAVIVSHGVAISMMRGLALGLDRQGMAALGNPQGVVIEITDGKEFIHEA